MGQGVEDIVARLRAVSDDGQRSQAIVASLFAENVELRHEPPLPTDGPVPGRALAEISRREVEAASRALADLHSATSITVEGSAFCMRTHIMGTLRDGTAVDVQTGARFTVERGQIVGVLAQMDDATMSQWAHVLAAGAFEIPAEFVSG
jgi:hypothetical protein